MIRRTPEFERFIAPARRYPQLWRIVIAAIVGVVVFALLAEAVIFALASQLQRLEGQTWFELLGAATLEYERARVTASTPSEVALIFVPFMALMIALFPMVAICKRRFSSLLGPVNPGLLHIAIGIALVLAFDLTYLGISTFFRWEVLSPNLDVSTWLLHLLWAVPLIFVQTSSEELVFRGYLTQQLAARFRNPILWMIFPSLIFALAHYDEALYGDYVWEYVLSVFVFALVATDLTRVTGTLGAAIGIHFANNSFIFVGAAQPSYGNGVTLFFTNYQLDWDVYWHVLPFARLLFLWLGFRLLLRVIDYKIDPIKIRITE